MKAAMHRTRSIALLAYIVTVVSLVLSLSSAYPISLELDEDEEKCFHYTIPEDDDVHMIFIAIPPMDAGDCEGHYIKTILAITKDGGENMKDFPKLPAEMKEQSHQVEQSSGTYVRVESHGRSVVPRNLLLFHQPFVFRNIHKSSGRKSQDDWDYDICFHANAGVDMVDILFDMVLVSAEARDGDDDDDDHVESEQRKMIHKEHFTPLESNFQQSIKHANKILSEMRYMERREQRMRQTAESTNTRVKYFSYLSVTVLVVTTYLQITYLKSYFKKKKLM